MAWIDGINQPDIEDALSRRAFTGDVGHQAHVAGEVRDVGVVGREHVLDPQALIGELVRLLRPGGRVILSTPNVQNAFSRLRYLCTGFFYQFGPWMCRQLPSDVVRDRGHIAPMTYLQLRYHFVFRGAHIESIDGDKWKRKWLIPLLLPFLLWGRLWARWIWRSEPEADSTECAEVIRHMNSGTLLFSRSLILLARKRANKPQLLG